jgi:hypothetical protein
MRELGRQDDADFERLLHVIVSDPMLEWEWVDLLSQLEYVGCRKILKAVPFEKVDREVLRHVAEEASHAFLLKSLVPWEDRRETRFSAIGWRYFQSIDARVSAGQDDIARCYPAVSWAVEQRVLRVYPAYARKTLSSDVKRALSTILAQEKRHHDVFERLTIGETSPDAILEIEAQCWDAFKTGMRLVLSESGPHGFAPAHAQSDV